MNQCNLGSNFEAATQYCTTVWPSQRHISSPTFFSTAVVMTAPQKQALQNYLTGTSWPNSCIFCTLKIFFSTTCFPLSEETTAILSIQLHSSDLSSTLGWKVVPMHMVISLSWWPPEEKPHYAEQHVPELKKRKSTQLCPCKELHSHECYTYSQNWILLEVHFEATQNESKKHFDKWTGKGCPVTLPLLQAQQHNFLKCLSEK